MLRYVETYPELFRLRQPMDHLFGAQTRRTVDKRYCALMERRDSLVLAVPRLAPIFDSLVRHYPLLVAQRAYDHPLIPLTNNDTES